MTSGAARGYGSVTPAELRDELAAGRPVRLVDVREPVELEFAHLDAAELVPLGALPAALGRFDRDDDVVVMCHHGIRSASACAFLARAGFARVRNLAGGIDRWSVDVDPNVPRY